MLSIKALRGANPAFYYLRSVPDGPSSYYAGSTPAGRWLGDGATQLDLVGAVRDDELRHLLDGHHPGTGAQLVAGRAGAADRVMGFDLTFSAPKSVSLLAVLSPDDVGDVVRRAHADAVADVMGVVESEVARVRRGRQGVDQLPAAIVAAAFDHHTSRAVDPQLHTHVVVLNAAHAADGRWSALYGQRLYRWAKTAGTLYQASLRAQLTEELGVRWGPVRNGIAEVEGITRAQIEAFSTRRADIAAELDRLGLSGPRSAQLAAWATRQPKTVVAEHELASRWRARAFDIGLTPDLVAGVVGPARQVEVSQRRLLDRLLGPDGLTAHASTFDRRQALAAIAADHPDGAAVTDVVAVADRLLGDRRAVALAGDTPIGDRRYTTAELLEIEARLLATARRPPREQLATATPDALAAALAARPTLAAEQHRMVEQVARAAVPVQVVIGRAGAGKTFALDAARAALDDSGVPVVGVALAARAAAELQAGAGIPSVTIDRLLADIDRHIPGAGLPAGGILVVDEAGMVGTRTLARLVHAARREGTRVVLVGDHRQLPEIAAGGAFAALAGTVPTVELVDNRRQHEGWERDALAELRHGDVSAAVATYDEHGRLHLAADAERARAALVADWFASRRAGDDTAIYALRRVDVEDLNRRARQQMAVAGLLRGEPLLVAGRAFVEGDEVLATRNDRRLGLRNGTRGVVVAVDPVATALVVATRDGELTVPEAYLSAGRLTHGYAMTVHKAQGATVDRAFVLGSEALYREAGYVALSRARTRTDFYLVAPAAPSIPERGHDPLDELVARLGRSQAQQLATPSQPTIARSFRELLAERDALRRRFADQPPLPDPDIDQDLARAARLRAAAQARLAAARQETRRRRGPAVARAADDLADATAHHDRTARRWLEQQHVRQELDRWERAHAEDVRRYTELAAEIAQRRQAIATTALAEPAPHLLDALGPPPPAGASRRRWVDAALTVETHRHRWEVTGIEPLGVEQPTDPEQARQRRTAQLAIDTTRRALTPELDLDHGMEYTR